MQVLPLPLLVTVPHTLLYLCRTLFVGNLLKHKYDTTKELEDTLWRHFCEWGELESINVIYRLSICFPRYRLRTSAEFAKEAMSNQSLDQSEILMVRWAHDDPNPIAQDSIERADRDALAALMRAKGIRVDSAAFEYPVGYDLPDAKRLKLDNGAVVDASIEYPNTDAQYQTTAATEDQYAQYYQQYVVGDAAPDAVTTAHSDQKEESSVQQASSCGSSWTEHLDDDTGATYYYNEATGESSWTRPEGLAS